MTHLASLVGLGLVYVGAVIYPLMDLVRYLGLGSTIMLTILSPQAIEALTKRGCAGAYYFLLLIFLAVIFFEFAGTLMPESPYTANPYTLWSISSPISHSETQELENLAPLLCYNNYLIDRRTGHYIRYKYIWTLSLFRGFYNPGNQSSFTYAGSCGPSVTPEYLESFNGILIFRKNSLCMLETYSSQTSSFLNNKAGEASIPYMSPQIKPIIFDHTQAVQR